MYSPSARLRIHAESRYRAIFSLVAGEAVSLSLLHHFLNLWGLPANKVLLSILVIGPIAAIMVFLVLGPMWNDCRVISRPRWAAFLIPAALIAAGLTWRYSSAPEVGHQLEIDPSASAAGHEVKITEIRAAYGNTVPLGNFGNLGGWSLEGDLLRARDSSAMTIRYAFTGPIGEQVRVRFITSPQGGTAVVVLDGKQQVYDLRGPDGNVTNARLDTLFRWGPINFLITPVLVLVDWLAALSVLAFIWAAYQIAQDRRPPGAVEAANGFPSHSTGLLIVIAVAIALHTISFLSVPLVLTKDSPSYLDGAVQWLVDGNLYGVPPYRGPGTTFLFAPAMAIFGRNPWGVKLALHLLALVCVPLAYWFGWRLGNRRWVALTAGLITALTPDLYLYSNMVMTEMFQVFVLLLFCALFVLALQTLSSRWIFTSVLSGSLAVLVRPENIVILCIYLVVLGIVLMRIPRRLPAIRKNLRNHLCLIRTPKLQLAWAFIIAVVPLLIWSAHNLRLHGFFGIGNLGSGALYDGWIYFGENSGIKIVEPQSEAVQKISALIPITANRDQAAPTVWTVHSVLVKDGYTVNDALHLLGRATIESILANPAQTWRLLIIKLREGFQPYAVLPDSSPAAREDGPLGKLKTEYFNAEPPLPAGLVHIRLQAYKVLARWYPRVYGVWLWLSALMLWLSSYRRPSTIWCTLSAIAATSVLLPNIVGMSMWRYAVPGLVVMLPITIIGLASLISFFVLYGKQARLEIRKILAVAQ